MAATKAPRLAPTKGSLADAVDALREYSGGTLYRPFGGSATEAAQEVSRQILGLCATLSSVCVSANEGDGVNVSDILLAKAFDGIGSLAAIALFLGEGDQ